MTQDLSRLDDRSNFSGEWRHPNGTLDTTTVTANVRNTFTFIGYKFVSLCHSCPSMHDSLRGDRSALYPLSVLPCIFRPTLPVNLASQLITSGASE